MAALQTVSREALAVDGEDCIEFVRHGYLLLLANQIFVAGDCRVSSPPLPLLPLFFSIMIVNAACLIKSLIVAHHNFT